MISIFELFWFIFLTSRARRALTENIMLAARDVSHLFLAKSSLKMALKFYLRYILSYWALS